jgi:hypothetical protein
MYTGLSAFYNRILSMPQRIAGQGALNAASRLHPRWCKG